MAHDQATWHLALLSSLRLGVSAALQMRVSVMTKQQQCDHITLTHYSGDTWRCHKCRKLFAYPAQDVSASSPDPASTPRVGSAVAGGALSSNLRFNWTWDANARNWRLTTTDMGDGLQAGYDHMAGYYERQLIEEIERLRPAAESWESYEAAQERKAEMGLTVETAAHSNQWLGPTPAMLADPRFEAIWRVIKSWDINVPHAYQGYCGATGNHVRAILAALSGDSSTVEIAADVIYMSTIEPQIDRIKLDGRIWMIETVRAALEAYDRTYISVVETTAPISVKYEHEIGELRSALKVAQQTLLEFSHAQECGPGWYTRGEGGMYAQVHMWLRRGLESVRNALGPYDDNGRYLKEMPPEEPSPDDYLILCRAHTHGYALWWRPKSAGYTNNLEWAGRYGRGEAEAIVRNSDRGEEMWPVALIMTQAKPRHMIDMGDSAHGFFEEKRNRDWLQQSAVNGEGEQNG